MTLGQKIRQARIERKMTQKQLVGDHITRNMLSKIENDSATPSVRTLEYIAARLDLPAGYFMTDSRYSDGTSPDGLDNMRAAYKEGRYETCIALLEGAPKAGTTDEGYLLRARASLGAARAALSKGDVLQAKEFADAADYYNREGMYYSAEIDAEMSLILAECALSLDLSEFESNAVEYERAVLQISFAARYALARAEYLLKTGEIELAGQVLNGFADEDDASVKKELLYGEYYSALAQFEAAKNRFKTAEDHTEEGDPLRVRIYQGLEMVYMQLGNFKKAYEYAAKQLR